MSIFTKINYNKKYLITHPWEIFIHYFEDISCAFQRARFGYCYKDLYNIDIWFLTIMPKMLQKFKEKSMTYPSFLTPEEWDDILDEMIFCFNEANVETCSLKNEIDYDVSFDFIEQDNGFHTLDIKYLTKEDKEKQQLYQKREEKLEKYRNENLKKGLNLFVKYFKLLWD